MTDYRKKKLKLRLLKSFPLLLVAWAGNRLSFAWRISPGKDIAERIPVFVEKMLDSLLVPVPSFHPSDLFWGALTAALFALLLYLKRKNAKKLRPGVEYGNARWGKPEEADVLKDHNDFSNNVILTQTEYLTMGQVQDVKFARNKNVEVIGGSGSGKTRFVVKPNLMQMHSSYVVTDPKGTVLVECGKMLQRGKKIIRNGKVVYDPYKIKVFNTVDFEKSMHYNPFAYISERNCEKDILKFIEVLIKNTSGSGEQSKEDFWVKAERLLYSAYIAMIFCLSPPSERNFETLIDMLNISEVREDDETFRNEIDVQFEAVERWLNNDFFDENEEPESGADAFLYDILSDMKGYEPTDFQRRIGNFALRQYKQYKLAAGKTAKSILISCSARLAVLSIDEILEITSYDELGLDRLGDERSALFVIVPDTDSTFNFLVAIMYTQMFNLLCTKADNNPGARLKYHVQCLLDEFANIGQIPGFEQLISTIRSRGISAMIILQAESQLKAIYKDNAATISANCDSKLFLGGDETTTVKGLSEALGKETIDLYNTSVTKGQSESSGLSYQKTGRELMTSDEIATMDGSKCILRIRGFRPFFSNKYDITEHKNYPLLSDGNPKNVFNIEKYVRGIGSSKATLKDKTVADQYVTNEETDK